MSTIASGSRSRRRVANMSMEEFVRHLSIQLQEPVRDATGLKGKYDFTLCWVFDTSLASTGGPDLFGAIQEQLGLQLDMKKEPVDLMVLDHIEHSPTENGVCEESDSASADRIYHVYLSLSCHMGEKRAMLIQVIEASVPQRAAFPKPQPRHEAKDGPYRE